MFVKKPSNFDAEQIIKVGCMALNLFSSICIVFCNKLVYTTTGFTFGTTLTLVHFIVTFFGLYLCKLNGVFTPKPLPLKSVAKISFAFCGFVVLTNLSLQYNSVAFYQVMKVLTTPYITTVQMLVYGKTFPKMILSSIGVTCVGAMVCSGMYICFFFIVNYFVYICTCMLVYFNK